MGEHNVEQEIDEGKAQRFIKALLEDLRALEYMLEHDRIESGVRRIGAEQEMFLVDRSCGRRHLQSRCWNARAIKDSPAKSPDSTLKPTCRREC